MFGRISKRRYRTLLWLLVGIGGGFILPSSGTAASADRDDLMEERRERLRAKYEMRFRAADLDQDRRLSLEELQASSLPRALESRFDQIDADGDGGLTPEELWAARERRLEAQKRLRGPKR